MATKVYDRSVFLAWRGNAYKHITLHFKHDPAAAAGYRERIDAINIDGDVDDVIAAFDAVKHDIYRTRNRQWLDEFLASEFPPGKTTPKSERAFLVRARNTDVTRPYFAWVMRSLRNELHNIRFNDDLITDPELLQAADPAHAAKRKALENSLTA